MTMKSWRRSSRPGNGNASRSCGPRWKNTSGNRQTAGALSLEGYGGVTEEDLYQSGFLALLDAVESYDHAAGMSFIGWLNLRLKNSFAEAAGYRSKKRDVLDYAEDIDAPINDADGLSVADLLAAPDGLQSFEKAEDRAMAWSSSVPPWRGPWR